MDCSGELMGYSALTFAVHLLAAVCQRLDELGRGGSTGVRPTSKLQLACFPAGSEGYVAHTDGSALEELEDSMPPDQRAMISSRRATCLMRATSVVSHGRPRRGFRTEGFRTASRGSARVPAVTSCYHSNQGVGMNTDGLPMSLLATNGGFRCMSSS